MSSSEEQENFLTCNSTLEISTKELNAGAFHLVSHLGHILKETREELI